MPPPKDRTAERTAPVARVVIRDWKGYVPNQSPHRAPGAAVSQVNCQSAVPGELRVRPGFAVVKFDT